MIEASITTLDPGLRRGDEEATSSFPAQAGIQGRGAVVIPAQAGIQGRGYVVIPAQVGIHGRGSVVIPAQAGIQRL
jgi:hypothetical protein